MTMAEVCQVTCLRLVERQVPTRKGHFRVGGNVKQSEARRQRETLNGEAEKSKHLESVDTFVRMMITQWHFKEAPPLRRLLGYCEAAQLQIEALVSLLTRPLRSGEINSLLMCH